MRLPHLLIVTVSAFSLSFAAQAKEIQTHGKICANPAQACTSAAYQFQAHELSFQLPEKLEWQSGHYSAEFYAVILRSMKAIPVQDTHGDEVCKGFVDESERLAMQAKFPDYKVFTSRNGCPSMVYYKGTNDKYNFIAVYAGADKAQATKVLELAKQVGGKDVNLRKMQVVVDSGD